MYKITNLLPEFTPKINDETEDNQILSTFVVEQTEDEQVSSTNSEKSPLVSIPDRVSSLKRGGDNSL
jgi:hypothetical protein